MAITNPLNLKGYILEEVIAFLIKNSGYHIIDTSYNGDPDLLVNGHDLRVKGRGSTHQVDVLGELDWPSAFTFPLRVFVEAKCYDKKTVGLNIIRNAVGTILDVNQNYFPKIVPEPRTKFHYSYAIFSTSGFSDNAVEMATAHQISIVDLSLPHFKDLVVAIDAASNELAKLAAVDNIYDLREKLRGKFDSVSDLDHLSLISQNRKKLTELEGPHHLEEVEKNRELPAVNAEDQYEKVITDLTEYVEKNEYFLLGTSYGPYLITLKSDNPQAFLEFIKLKPKHYVKISYTRDERMVWYITPVGKEPAYTLYFSLPEKLGDWIFSNEDNRIIRSRQVKSSIFSKLTLFHRDQEGKLFVAELIYENPVNS